MSKIKYSVIWITGASSGIGEELAYQLSKAGARLILSARRKKELERVAGNCKGDNVQILPLDLEKPELMNVSVEAAIQYFGHVDILINNGGISQRSLVQETSMDVYRKLMEVNYFGTIALSLALLPHFIKNRNGHFVNVTSIVGKIGSPYRSGYAASKHALHGFFDSLRAEHYDDNISVSMICPGWVNTAVSINALTGDGSPLGKTDRAQSEGMSVTYCAKRIVEAIKSNKAELYLGGREKLGVYVMRYWPALFRRILRKARVR